MTGALRNVLDVSLWVSNYILHKIMKAVQLNSTQLKGVYFQKYTVSINCNIGLKPTLVYLPHYYWVQKVQSYLCAKYQLVSTCAHTKTHTKHCAWQIFQEKNRSFHTWIANIEKVQKCIHSRYSLGFINSFLASLTHWLIEAETKWRPFRRRHFQMHFLQLKCLNLDYNFTEVCS